MSGVDRETLLRDQLAEVTGCHRLTGGAAEWCETYADDWPCKVGRLEAIARGYAAEQVQPMDPARWWRVIAPDGSLWCETSSEKEARLAVRPGDKLQRLWERTESEWRDAR